MPPKINRAAMPYSNPPIVSTKSRIRPMRRTLTHVSFQRKSPTRGRASSVGLRAPGGEHRRHGSMTGGKETVRTMRRVAQSSPPIKRVVARDSAGGDQPYVPCALSLVRFCRSFLSLPSLYPLYPIYTSLGHRLETTRDKGQVRISLVKQLAIASLVASEQGTHTASGVAGKSPLNL